MQFLYKRLRAYERKIFVSLNYAIGWENIISEAVIHEMCNKTKDPHLEICLVY